MLLFKLCNGPATIEQLMKRVLAGVPRCRCVVYLDDTADVVSALTNLREVLKFKPSAKPSSVCIQGSVICSGGRQPSCAVWILRQGCPPTQYRQKG